MSTNSIILYQVVIKNKVKAGYRRAGLSLDEGENHLSDITAEQLKQLQGDSRLAVLSFNEIASIPKNDGLPHQHNNLEPKDDSTDQEDLNSLTVDKLKSLLTERNVPFKSSANKAELIALIEQAKVAGDQ